VSPYTISPLSGAVPADQGPKMGSGTIDAGVWNGHVQVFELSKWPELVAGVAKCAADKVSLVVPLHLRVLENKAQGVQGGFDAHVVFVFNSMPEAWQAALPQHTKDALLHARFKDFPYIPTTKLDYDPDLASYLSQMSSWNMLQALPAVHSLLKGGGGWREVGFA